MCNIIIIVINIINFLLCCPCCYLLAKCYWCCTNRDNAFSVCSSNTYIENLEELFTIITPLANEKGIEIQLDPTLGTKYKLYSGLTFELISNTSNAPIVIAKGGRYDDLVKKFSVSEKNSYGIGFSFSIDKIRELITTNQEVKQDIEKVLIAYKKSDSLSIALSKQKEWHNQGIVSVISHEPFSTDEQTNQLLKINRCTRLEWIEWSFLFIINKHLSGNDNYTVAINTTFNNEP